MKRYGSYYVNSDLGDGQVNEWYERGGEAPSNFLFCNRCYDEHGSALMTRKRMWYNDEPIGEMVEYDRAIYPCPWIRDESEDPDKCDHCGALIRERKDCEVKS